MYEVVVNKVSVNGLLVKVLDSQSRVPCSKPRGGPRLTQSFILLRSIK